MARIVICPFCDAEIRRLERVVKCANCGEAFEPDEDDLAVMY